MDWEPYQFLFKGPFPDTISYALKVYEARQALVPFISGGMDPHSASGCGCIAVQGNAGHRILGNQEDKGT